MRAWGGGRLIEIGYGQIMQLRRATLADLELLVRIDREGEGVTYRDRTWSERERDRGAPAAHPILRDRRGSAHRGGRGELGGAILWRVRDLATVEEGTVFRAIDPAVFPADGRFAEIFQLWVERVHRRRGIATALKRAAEHDARARGIGMIYTHTEQKNTHVLALNEKLGYHEVRRGPIWDEIERVSLVKGLAQRIELVLLTPPYLRGEPVDLGYIHVGEQIDEIDGFELIYEMMMA